MSAAKHAVFDLGRVLASSPSRYALLLLNQSVLSESRFATLWKCARVRSCVDGGANRHELFNSQVQANRTMLR